VAKYFRHYEIQAKVDAVDARARTLSISGITVKIPADCTFEDENGDETTLEKLPVGRKMEVEGDWTGPAEFTCYSIEVWKEKKEECPAGDRKSCPERGYGTEGRENCPGLLFVRAAPAAATRSRVS